MTEDWIRRYFTEAQVPQVMEMLSEYGTEEWHKEQERVRRDAVIISRGSVETLRSTIKLAMRDYRDVLISEQVDRYVIEELGKNKA